MEGDGLGLDLALFDIDLVTGKNNRNVFADTDEVTCRACKRQLKTSSLYHDLRCQLGTFLYVMREVTSNMIIPHWPLM